MYIEWIESQLISFHDTHDKFIVHEKTH